MNTPTTKEQAMKIVDAFIEKLTPDQAKDIIAPNGRLDLENARNFVLTFGLTGFYYNTHETWTCNNVLLNEIIRQAEIFYDNH